MCRFVPANRIRLELKTDIQAKLDSVGLVEDMLQGCFLAKLFGEECQLVSLLLRSGGHDSGSDFRAKTSCSTGPLFICRLLHRSVCIHFQLFRQVKSMAQIIQISDFLPRQIVKALS